MLSLNLNWCIFLQDFHLSVVLVEASLCPCSGSPEAPSMVRLSVSSSTTLTVTFQEPQCLNSTVVTKYRGTNTLRHTPTHQNSFLQF